MQHVWSSVLLSQHPHYSYTVLIYWNLEIASFKLRWHGKKKGLQKKKPWSKPILYSAACTLPVTTELHFFTFCRLRRCGNEIALRASKEFTLPVCVCGNGMGVVRGKLLNTVVKHWSSVEFRFGRCAITIHCMLNIGRRNLTTGLRKCSSWVLVDCSRWNEMLYVLFLATFYSACWIQPGNLHEGRRHQLSSTLR